MEETVLFGSKEFPIQAMRKNNAEYWFRCLTDNGRYEWVLGGSLFYHADPEAPATHLMSHSTGLFKDSASARECMVDHYLSRANNG